LTINAISCREEGGREGEMRKEIVRPRMARYDKRNTWGPVGSNHTVPHRSHRGTRREERKEREYQRNVRVR
jgi:transposase